MAAIVNKVYCNRAINFDSHLKTALINNKINDTDIRRLFLSEESS